MILHNNSLITVTSLDQLDLPTYLDGRDGSNRSDTKHKLIDADTDLDAIRTWLAEFSDSPQTFRNYRKEAERLLLWALIEQAKPLSSLSRNDFIEYESFLLNPQPIERWCGSRAERHSLTWRPFRGALRPQSQHQALIICQALFNFLVEAGYLAGNPLALRRRKRKKITDNLGPERYLEQDVWEFLLGFINKLPKDTLQEKKHFERTRYLFSFLYLLGPRVSEIASHTMGSFIEVRGNWWWNVTGKGQKTVKIPVNKDMLGALVRYREFYGLSAYPEPDEEVPLIMSIKGTYNISANMIYRIVKKIVNSAADKMRSIDCVKAEKLRKASTHWFRHTAITHQADAGVELRFLNKSARHEKFDTTAGYLHADDEAWHNVHLMICLMC